MRLSNSVTPATVADSIDWALIKSSILQGLNLAAEFEALGVEFTTAVASPDGWRGCRALDREDAHPSAACNVMTGVYVDRGRDTCLGFFDFALQHGRFGRFLDVIRHYGQIAGVSVPRPSTGKGGRFLEAEFIYTDLKGQARYAATRYREANGSKSCGQKRWTERGWDSSPGCMEGVDPLPFHLSNLIRDECSPVLVVEGEPKVIRLEKEGFLATTSHGGSGNVRNTWPVIAPWFEGRQVVILPDNDSSGTNYGRGAAEAIKDVAASVRWLALPGLPLKGDIVDWFAMGGSRNELLALLSQAPLYEPSLFPDEIPRVYGPSLKTTPIQTARPRLIAVGSLEEQVISGDVGTNGLHVADPESPPEDSPPVRNLDPAALPYYERNDKGNSLRLLARHGEDIRYCAAWDSGRLDSPGWLIWDGSHWHEDSTGESMRLAIEVQESMLEEASRITDDDLRKLAHTWSIQTGNKARLEAMLKVGGAMRPIASKANEWDCNPWVWNCPNGTIELHTGELRPHARSDMMRLICPTPFDPNAKCTLWEQVLTRIFRRQEPSDTNQLVRYFQRLCGYAMTGLIRDHVMPIFFGAGSNGKSTVITALLGVFGRDYGMTASPELLISDAFGKNKETERADLFGKRLVVAQETKLGSRLDEVMVKSLTGGDTVHARRLYQSSFEFSPTHTIFMATNHKPSVQDTGHAMWRRLSLLPFTETITDDEKDLELGEKLKKEYEGILAWVVRGCLAWQEEGVAEPQEVTSATSDYRIEQDVFGQFMTECLELSGMNRIRAVALYTTYAEWSKSRCERPYSAKMFAIIMRERGLSATRTNGIWYEGVDVRPEFRVKEESPF